MLKKGHSKKTLAENIAIELKSGKPRKQAIAIGYSQQRKALKNKGKKVG